MSNEDDCVQSQAIQDEINVLEKRLQDAKDRLSKIDHGNGYSAPPMKLSNNEDALTTSPNHYLLLLSDSALPLGSFAFSSGLESYLAHSKPSSSFNTFLELSLAAYASTTLPFVLAAHRDPLDLVELDDLQDAAIMCTVARRASVAQGRALLSIWDRSIRSSVPESASIEVLNILKDFSVLLRSTPSNHSAMNDLPIASAHLGPLFGAIANILGLSLQQTAYIFMLSHVKALLSAAVRASMFGPYQAQKILASVGVQDGISRVIQKEWNTRVEDAGQVVPVMDLWVGRHEMLYSRIFNS